MILLIASLTFQTWGNTSQWANLQKIECKYQWHLNRKVQSHYSAIYDKNGIFLPKKGGRMQTKKIEDQVIFVLVIVMVVPLVFYNK